MLRPERCLAVGMTDYIAKPVSVRELLAKLAAVTGRRITLGAAAAARKPGDALLDADGALERLDGNRALLRRLLTRFHDDQPAALAALGADWKAGRDEEARRGAHTLKGLAGNIGAERLAKLCAALESGAAAGDGAPAFDWDALEDCFRETRSAIDAALGVMEPAAGSPAQAADSTLASALVELDQLLSADDARAARRIEALQPMLAGRLAEGELESLSRMTRAYDFEGASTMLRRLAGMLGVKLD